MSKPKVIKVPKAVYWVSLEGDAPCPFYVATSEGVEALRTLGAARKAAKEAMVEHAEAVRIFKVTYEAVTDTMYPKESN